MRFLFPLILFSFLFRGAFAQKNEDFVKPFGKLIKDSSVIVSRVGYVSKRTFLGIAKTPNGDTGYYIFKEFYDIQWHGHSRLVIFNKFLKYECEIIVDMPDELPYKYIENTLTLYFHYTESKTNKKKIHTEIVTVPFNKVICIEPNNRCYFKDTDNLFYYDSPR